MAFTINGQIREMESGVGVPNLRIEAWDKDLFFDDKLGGCFTNSEGCFKLSYTEDKFRDLFEKCPDIYLKVFAPNDVPLHSTARHVRWQSGKQEYFDIKLPRETLGECSPNQLTNTEENMKRRKYKPHCELDYECCKPNHSHESPPDNPRYPDPRIYGDYASKKPPPYVPHPYEHTCFKPREEDYKPPATCDGEGNDNLCSRRDHRTLTNDQRDRFLNAFTQINLMNALGPLVDIHANATHQMHSNPRFLPWHRIYLLRMEELLQTVDPTVCVPYWKSSEEQAFPSWLLGFTPTVNLMGGPHTVTRNIGGAILPNTSAVTTVMGNGTFNTFASALEGVHNSGHVWIGGSMGVILTAPTDPVFWMHHAEIDRIWAEWQVANPGQNPSLSGGAEIMDPWSEDEADTRDITSLGYIYV